MIFTRQYYLLKPYLPWRVRIALRRWRARRRRSLFSASWPILEAAGKAPPGWSGWPDGKQFAFVLTHDVETQKGVDRCQQLSELDARFGIRSAFNFIPEGEYTVPPDLRHDLAARGSEVGIHDLEHDGKLFRSRDAFRNNARRINRRLQEWRAAGFRSGFMHHNLDWFHDLDILYDASTFDTDPFEPQPDGVGTIFPFWVPRTQGRGYVELPYTLVQDFTLFVVLRETTIDIWKKKLDWIVSKGGMALMIVHPDYVNFSNGAPAKDEFPVALYEEFLRYVTQRYAGSYWQALPREVAGLVRQRQAEALSKAPPVGLTRPANDKPRPRIWIDLDNTPHVLFFEPIIEELRARGFPLVVTARDAFQVCELADRKALSYVRIGRHYGKNRVLKLAGLMARALQLAPLVLQNKPILSISHGARSQILLSNLLRIPTLLLADYEYAKYPPLMHPTWEMVPDVIPDEGLCCDRDHILKYPGIKEDVYVWKFQPDARFLGDLGLSESDLIVTVRPPATEAHYHNPESEGLFVSFMERACRFAPARIVLLPRNKKQGQFIRSRWPEWFINGKTVIPGAALDGLNLIWHSDLLVSGGGTMNREAAALGVPVYSIFRGAIGAVDLALEESGRLILVTSIEEVTHKIRLEKRVRQPLAGLGSKKSLNHIVDTIERLADSLAPQQSQRSEA